jgi:hypothetical protein
MSKVVNLRSYRKRKGREADAATAAGNRARFGRTKEQKKIDAAQDAEARKRMEQLRRETPEKKD